MTMTEYQKTLVEQNMRLIDWVLKSRITVPTSGIYTYDECYAIGCEALGKAAMAYHPDKGEFEAFACRCIYNRILDVLRKEQNIIQHSNRCIPDEDGEFPEFIVPCDNPDYEDMMVAQRISEAFNTCKARHSGIVLHGLEAMELKAIGYSSREIAEMFGTDVHNLNAWISKARKKLYAEPEFAAVIN